QDYGSPIDQAFPLRWSAASQWIEDPDSKSVQSYIMVTTASATNPIPGFGSFSVLKRSPGFTGFPAFQVGSLTVSADPGYCVVGAGAVTTTTRSDVTRALTRIKPFQTGTTAEGIEVGDKDHLIATSGLLNAELIEIQKAP